MRVRSSPLPFFAGAVAAFALAAALGACSFIVESSDQQCQANADCARFPGTRCDTLHGVCVAADGGADAAGCEAGADGGC